jgi:hypothetical protein
MLGPLPFSLTCRATSSSMIDLCRPAPHRRRLDRQRAGLDVFLHLADPLVELLVLLHQLLHLLFELVDFAFVGAAAWAGRVCSRQTMPAAARASERFSFLSFGFSLFGCY